MMMMLIVKGVKLSKKVLPFVIVGREEVHKSLIRVSQLHKNSLEHVHSSSEISY